MAEIHLTDTTRAEFGHKTKGRILATSLSLFNAHGYSNVTTAKLASAADVLEGTLWYHFRTKQDLALHHLDTFEARLDATLNTPISKEPDGILDHLFNVFELLWDFRYLLRDPMVILGEEDGGAHRLRQIYIRVEHRAEDRIRQAADADLLRLGDTSIEHLSRSCVITGRYWLDYASIRFDEDMTSAEIQALGLQQLVTLFNPYLTPNAKQLFRRTLNDGS